MRACIYCVCMCICTCMYEFFYMQYALNVSCLCEQVILISTGNLSFLNWLTIVPSIWFFDDKFLARFFPWDTVERVSRLQAETEEISERPSKFYRRVRQVFHCVLATLIAYLSLPTVVNLMSAEQVMNTSFEPLRIVNTYGAFGSVTKERTEVKSGTMQVYFVKKKTVIIPTSYF